MCSFSLLGFFKLKKNKEKEGIIILTCSTIDRSIMGPKKIKEIKQVAGQQTINLAALLQKKINDEKEEERKKKEEGDERRKEKRETRRKDVGSHNSSQLERERRRETNGRLREKSFGWSETRRRRLRQRDAVCERGGEESPW